MSFVLANEYMQLKAPLLQDGQFGIEIRGTIDPGSRQDVADLLTRASEFNAAQRVDACGIVLDFTRVGEHHHDEEILHLPLRQKETRARQTGEIYFLSGLICLLLIFALCVQRD